VNGFVEQIPLLFPKNMTEISVYVEERGHHSGLAQKLVGFWAHSPM
jgi:hypothetical protein